MRLSTRLITTLLLTLVPGSSVAAPPEAEAEAEAEVEVMPEQDLLGELVVEAKRRAPLVLPKIVVLRPAGESSSLHAQLERDLELSGEFEVVQVDHAMQPDDTFDPSPFVELGIEAVITASAQALEGGGFDLGVRLYLPSVGELVAWSKTVSAGAGERRLAGHRLSDGIIGALTGTDGPFASRLVLVRTEGKSRRAYLVDADGKGLERLSPDEHLVVTATLDRDARPYWAASTSSGRYRLYRQGEPAAIPLSPSGSIYGLAFAPNGTELALAIASGADIQVFTGSLGSDPLSARTKLDFALTPTFTADGRLVYAGTRGKRRSVYVGTKPVSPKQVVASSPTVCNHPDGARLVYAVGLDKNTDLVSSSLSGDDMVRLTWARGRNYAPACSPDGRLVAYFSTRKQDGGPGLYLMRVDGRRPKRIHSTLGDVLMWARIPARAKLPAASEGAEPTRDAAAKSSG